MLFAQCFTSCLLHHRDSQDAFTSTHQSLCMSSKCPATDDEQNTREHCTPSTSSEPNANQSTADPNDAKERVLQVLVAPRPAVVLGKGIDETPRSEYASIDHLLRAALSLEPEDANLHAEQHNDSVRDESRAHEVMRHALAQPSAKAPAAQSNDAKHHFRPADNGKRHAKPAVHAQHARTHPLPAPLEMQLEVRAQQGLSAEVEDQERG